jgi:hypothetical protein
MRATIAIVSNFETYPHGLARSTPRKAPRPFGSSGVTSVLRESPPRRCNGRPASTAAHTRRGNPNGFIVATCFRDPPCSRKFWMVVVSSAGVTPGMRLSEISPRYLAAASSTAANDDSLSAAGPEIPLWVTINGPLDVTVPPSVVVLPSLAGRVNPSSTSTSDTPANDPSSIAPGPSSRNEKSDGMSALTRCPRLFARPCEALPVASTSDVLRTTVVARPLSRSLYVISKPPPYVCFVCNTCSFRGGKAKVRA